MCPLYMHKKFGSISRLKIWEIIIPFTKKQMFFYLLTFSRIFEIYAWKITSLMPVVVVHCKVCLLTLVWKKITGVNLEFLRDPDMLLMFEKGIRGGVSMILTRYSKANNKYMGDQYDETKKDVYIQYLDANNLYGWAMSKPLPVRGFKLISESKIKKWERFSEQERTGCILEIDLVYPQELQELHELHNEYPLASERLMTNKVEKLFPNLRDKGSHVLHNKICNKSWIWAWSWKKFAVEFRFIQRLG